jgi:hypothetical protein
MGSKTVQTKTPFEQKQEYGWMSMPGNDPNVQRYLNREIQVDPGVGRRTDLAEQASENQWNSAFTSGIPQHVKMALQGAESRAIRGQGAAEQQQANYAKQGLELARDESMLPRLMQTGSSGFNTQVTEKQSPWGAILGGAMSMIPKF